MSDLQTTEPHLRIAHSILEQMMGSVFTEHEIKILLFILRLSRGCNRHSAYIPHQKDFEIIGVPECRIKSRLDYLVRTRVIFRDGDYYQLNKNCDEWKISPSPKFIPENLTRLISLNLKGNDRDLGELNNLLSSGKEELYKTSSQNFTKSKVEALQNVNSSTPDSASPKEILNKYIYKSNKYIDITNGDSLEVAETFPREAGEIWSRVLRELRPQVSALNYRTWLDKTAGLGYFHDDFIVGVNNVQVLEYLDHNLRPLLSKTLINVAEKPFNISFLNGETDIY